MPPLQVIPPVHAAELPHWQLLPMQPSPSSVVQTSPPPVHRHVPEKHVAVGAHVTPQAPQFASDMFRFVSQSSPSLLQSP